MGIGGIGLPGTARHEAGPATVTDAIGAIPLGGSTLATRLRLLLLPGLINVRVLYFDSDPIAHADVAPLLDIDLKGNPIAAVRNFPLVKHCNRYAEWHDAVSKNMRPHLVHDNFNTGVVLID